MTGFRALRIPFDSPDLFEEAFDDDPREQPDNEFADERMVHCPDHGDTVFTCCGVTRCVVCKRVVG